MFENNIAFTLSASREGHWRLAEFCDNSGFMRATAYRNVHVLSQQIGTHLPFGVMDDTVPVEALKEAVSDIRSNTEIDIAFMPIMLLTSTTTENFVSQCIAVGFDDILGLPCRTAEFTRRARLQFDNDREYFRTETYFGPDRRRGAAQASHPMRRGGKGYDFEKILIRRNRRTGVKILNHEKFGADDVMAAFA